MCVYVCSGFYTIHVVFTRIQHYKNEWYIIVIKYNIYIYPEIAFISHNQHLSISISHLLYIFYWKCVCLSLKKRSHMA